VGSLVRVAGKAVLDSASRLTLKIQLITGPTPSGPQLNSASVPTNVPAYLWLPIIVPLEAQWMSFRFRIEGDGGSDAFVMGIDGTNRFALATQFIGRGVVETSTPIDVSDLAGRNVECFFGIVGGSSTNCKITVDGIDFRSFAPPVLSVEREAERLTVSWAASAPDWDLEQARSLSDTQWTSTDETPVLFGGRYWLVLQPAGAARFYRLRYSFGAIGNEF